MIRKQFLPNFDFDDQKTWNISTYPGIFENLCVYSMVLVNQIFPGF